MFMKKLVFLVAICLIVSMLCTPFIASNNESNIQAANKESTKSKIPTQMAPGTVITYGTNNKPSISVQDASVQSISAIKSTEVVDEVGRVAEDAFCDAIRDSVKDLPVTNLGWQLPDPAPGMVVMYGSDGHINHIYSKDTSSVSVTSTIPTTTVPYPGRLPAGVYTFGTNQKVTINSSSVLGEGRFTVFRAGVGGSGTVGSSGKTLGTGDVATKRQIDNPRHNTAISARALDTNILKTVYKNDIGSLPDAVMDVYFWNWTDYYFGYLYSDTLSFSARYYYTF
jgi:hypothetical protein